MVRYDEFYRLYDDLPLEEGLLNKGHALRAALMLTNASLTPSAYGQATNTPPSPSGLQVKPPEQKQDSRPRGIRNNNPGNIRVGEKWAGISGQDGNFLQFSSPEYGIRALAKNIKTSVTHHKCNTVQSLISRWAPSSENYTGKYIQFVSFKLGIKPTEPLNIFDKHGKLQDEKKLVRLVQSIIQFENGQCPYSTNVIQKGINLTH